MAAFPTYVLDANLLLRMADSGHPHHTLALAATKALRADGAILRTLPQSLFEFWTVATRDVRQNGLGLTVGEAEKFVDLFTLAYWTIPDDPVQLSHWRRLVVQYNVVGKNGHDTRYIASMQAHGITHILTFDSDFNRYSAEGIVVVNPANVPSFAGDS